jgi:hypothetical protein
MFDPIGSRQKQEELLNPLFEKPLIILKFTVEEKQTVN